MKTVLLLTLLVLSLLACPVSAEPPLASKIPADAMLYMGWAGRNPTFDASMVGQLMQSPTAKDIVNTLTAALRQQFLPEESAKAMDTSLAMLNIAWQHPLALAVMPAPQASPESTGPGGRVTWGAMIPPVSLLIDLGTDRAAFAAKLDELLALFAEELPLREGPSSGELKFSTFQPGEDGPVFSVGYIGNMFFLTVGAGMPDVLTSLTADKSLASAPGFLAAYKEVTGADEQTVFFADVPAIKNAAMAFAGPQEPMVTTIIDAVGLDKLTTLAATMRVVDGGMYTKMRLRSPAPHHGVLMLYAGQPLGDEPLTMAPADTDFLLAWRIDPQDVMDELRRCLAVGSPELADQFGSALDQADEVLGLSIEEDLLAYMGDRLTLVSAPSWGGILTGTALVIDLKDPQRFSQSLAKLEGLFEARMQPRPMRDGEALPVYERQSRGSPQLQRTESNGQKITYVKCPGSRIPVAPAWTVAGNRLIVALWPQVVQGVLTAPQGQLAKDPAFVKAMSRVSPSKANVITYTNLPKLVREFYPLPLFGWTMAANGAAHVGLPLEISWLPSLKTAEKFLWPAASTIANDPEGFTAESYGSGLEGFISILNPLVPLTVSAALPALGQAREKAKEASSTAALRSIALATILYGAENRGQGPTDFEVLLKKRLIQPGNLVSPLSNTKAYVLIPHKNLDWIHNASQTILAYEDPTTHGREQTAVAFADGHVELVDVGPKLDAMIEESKAAAAGVEPEDRGF